MALKHLADRKGLRWHQGIYCHPLKGDVPMNSCCWGEYRRLAVFAGWVWEGSAKYDVYSDRGIYPVLEMNVASIPQGMTPLWMRWIPRQASPNTVLYPEGDYDRYFSGPPGPLSGAAKTALLKLGAEATKLVVEHNRLLVAPRFSTKRNAIKSLEQMEVLLERCDEVVDALGAQRFSPEEANVIYDESSYEGVWDRYRKHGRRRTRASVYIKVTGYIVGIALIVLGILLKGCFGW